MKIMGRAGEVCTFAPAYTELDAASGRDSMDTSNDAQRAFEQFLRGEIGEVEALNPLVAYLHQTTKAPREVLRLRGPEQRVLSPVERARKNKLLRALNRLR